MVTAIDILGKGKKLYWIIVLFSFYFLGSVFMQHLARKTPFSLSVSLFWLMVILFELGVKGNKYFWAGAWGLWMAICLQFLFTHSRVRSIAWKIVLLFLLMTYSMTIPLWFFPMLTSIFPFYLLTQKKVTHRLLRLAMMKYLGALIVGMIYLFTGHIALLLIPVLFFSAQILNIILVSQYVQKNLAT